MKSFTTNIYPLLQGGLIGLLLALAPNNAVFAQNTQTIAKDGEDVDFRGWYVRKEIRKGSRDFDKGRYQEAIEHLDKALEETHNENYEANFLKGLCYLESYKLAAYPKAIPSLKYVYEHDPFYHKELPFLLGMAYQLNSQYDKALKYYKYFKKESDAMKLYQEQLVNERIAQCNNALQMLEDGEDSTIVVENAGPKINSPYRDYAPVLDRDHSKLIFTSDRPNTTSQKWGLNGRYYEDIYKATFGEEGWQEAQNMGDNINHKWHTGSAYLTPDGKTLYIYRDKNENLVYSKQDASGDWSEHVPLPSPINTEEHAELSFCMNKAGTKAYFSSNRPGGQGGLDLYHVDYDPENDSWSEPKNVGPPINTPENEESPYLVGDSVLYFASEGHHSVGGYDIYRASKTDKGWSQPKNMGLVINSPEDDFQYVTFNEGKNAYFSSSRPGGHGDLDIYQVTFNTQREVHELLAKAGMGTIGQEKRQSQLKKEKPKKATAEKNQKSEPANKKAIAQKTDQAAEKENQKPGNKANDQGTEKEKDSEAPITRADQQATAGPEEEGSSGKPQQTAAVSKEEAFRGYQFEINSSALKGASKEQVDKLYQYLKAHPEIKILIVGHTDTSGPDDFNNLLSRHRALNVLRHLKMKGVDENRVDTKGVADQQAKHSNKNKLGRQLNRRAEVRIQD